jgi:uncharacterized membrane protein YbhN (UPF0104 family)
MEAPPPQTTPDEPAPDPAVAEVVGLAPVHGYATPARSRVRLWVRLAVAAVVLAVLAVAGRRFYGELDRLKSAPLWVVLVMAALYVAARFPPVDLLRAALASLGHRVGRVETFFVLMVQYYVNMLIPRAGIGAPAAYMKLRHGVPISDLGAAQVVTLTLAQFACLGTAALACLAALASTGAVRWDPILAAAFAGVAVVSAAPLLLPLPGIAERPAARVGGGAVAAATRFLGRLAYACRRLGRDRALLARAFAGHAIVLLLRALRVQLSFRAVGVHVGFWQAFIASAAADVMFLVSITPGALGFREGGMMYAARVLGTTGDVALAAAVLDRLVLTGCNLVLGQIGMWRYIGRPSIRPSDQ